MKSHLKACTLLLLIMAVSLLSACEGKKTEEPQLKIKAGNKKIQVISYGNQQNQTREGLGKMLDKAIKGKKLENLPYVTWNEEITIEAENFQTKEFTVSDYALNKVGTFYYDDIVKNNYVVSVSEGRGIMNLSTNPLAAFSCSISDHLPGNTIRGFIVRTDIEGSSYTFAFVLRTDTEQVPVTGH